MTLPNETLSDPESEGAIQIDLIDILFELKKHWFIILLCGILGFGLMAVYTKFFVRPVYKSSSQIYIRGSDTVASLADLQIGSSLTSDYASIFTGRPVLEEVIEAPGYPRSGFETLDYHFQSVRHPDSGSGRILLRSATGGGYCQRSG